MVEIIGLPESRVEEVATKLFNNLIQVRNVIFVFFLLTLKQNVNFSTTLFRRSPSAFNDVLISFIILFHFCGVGFGFLL